jgi:hypothetical protein
MGTCTSQPTHHTIVYPPSTHPYKSAGILFIDGPVALAGIQKHRKVIEGSIDARLSGFGGRKEEQDIDWIHTAIRETIEELFDVKHVSVTLIQQIRTSIPYREPIQEGEYIMMRCNFTDLKTILLLASKHLSSPLYQTQPQSLNELILKRIPQPTSEIGALALVPISISVLIDPDFSEDLKKASANRT